MFENLFQKGASLAIDQYGAEVKGLSSICRIFDFFDFNVFGAFVFVLFAGLIMAWLQNTPKKPCSNYWHSTSEIKGRVFRLHEVVGFILMILLFIFFYYSMNKVITFGQKNPKTAYVVSQLPDCKCLSYGNTSQHWKKIENTDGFTSHALFVSTSLLIDSDFSKKLVDELNEKNQSDSKVLKIFAYLFLLIIYFLFTYISIGAIVYVLISPLLIIPYCYYYVICDKCHK